MEILCPYIEPSPEFGVLLALMQGKTALPDGLDLPRLERLIRKNRLELLAGAHLENAGAVLPKGENHALTIIRQISTLSRIAAVFRKNGVRMLSAKGPLLAMDIYGTPALRTSHDLDLLVPLADVEKARDLIIAEGFSWYEADRLTTPKRVRESFRSQHHWLFYRDELFIELHWRLLPWGTRDFETLWAARQSRTLAGTQVEKPGPMHQLLFLIAHDARHGFHRLRWLADLCVLLPRHAGDMDALYAQMRAIRQHPLLIETWLLLLRLRMTGVQEIAFGGVLLRCTPDGVRVTCPKREDRALLQAARLIDALLPMLEADEDTEGNADFRRYARALPANSLRTGGLARIVDRFRPKPWDWAWIDLPDSLYFLYWVIRPVNKIRRILDKPSHKG